jgi:mRNA interferase RelE/StbE
LSYQVLIERRAQKEILRLPSQVTSRVTAAIDGLMIEPRPPNCRKLSGCRSQWRLRVGDYRILYEIDDSSNRVQVYAVGHRREVYR